MARLGAITINKCWMVKADALSGAEAELWSGVADCSLFTGHQRISVEVELQPERTPLT